MSTISASTTSTTAFKVTSDTTGTLVFQTGAVPTTAISIDASQAVGIGTSSPGYKLTVAGASGSAVLNLLESGVRSWGVRAGGTATNTFDIADFTAGATRLTINSSGNLGLGTTSPTNTAGFSRQLQIEGTTAALTLSGTTGTGKYTLGVPGTNAFGLWDNTASAYRLFVDSSGNVGIGTSSPAAKLQVVSGNIRLDNNQGIEWGGANNFIYGNETTDIVAIATNGNERLRVDSSGNLGLGVTPSAWNTYTAAQVQQLSLASFTNGDGRVSNNCFYDSSGNWKYINTRFALQYLLDAANGAHKWNIAGSGTAGNAITFTQAMTLNTSGRLGLGVTSPSSFIHAKDPAAADVTYRFEPSTNSYKSTLYVSSASSGDGGIRYDSNLNQTTLISYGNMLFCVGTANISGSVGDERARITSAGAFLIGTTSQINAGLLNLAFDTGTFCGIATKPTNNAGYDAARFFNSSTTQIGSISCTASATAYNTSSDYRLKNTVAPMTGALAKVALLKPVTYKWNADGSDGQGFIAHELAEVVPDCVTGEKDAVDAEGKPRYQGVDTSFLVATLTAAIQELTARVAALEGNN